MKYIRNANEECFILMCASIYVFTLFFNVYSPFQIGFYYKCLGFITTNKQTI
jgi:hypothetical protein